MSNLKNQLIRLGNQKPSLRKHLRPILASLKTAKPLTEERKQNMRSKLLAVVKELNVSGGGGPNLEDYTRFSEFRGIPVLESYYRTNEIRRYSFDQDKDNIRKVLSEHARKIERALSAYRDVVDEVHTYLSDKNYIAVRDKNYIAVRIGLNEEKM